MVSLVEGVRSITHKFFDLLYEEKLQLLDTGDTGKNITQRMPDMQEAIDILSNGIYDSTLHRAINSSPTYGVCVAYFYETNYDAAMEPLEVCVHRSGGTRKLAKAVYGEHLVSKVKTNFVM